MDTKETNGLNDVNKRFATGRTKHEDKGPEYAKLAVAKGQKHAHAYEKCKVHPRTGVNYDDNGFWDGCLTVRRARAQQDSGLQDRRGLQGHLPPVRQQEGLRPGRAAQAVPLRGDLRTRQVNRTLDDTHKQLVAGSGNWAHQGHEGHHGSARREPVGH